jgi:hypothetical protein
MPYDTLERQVNKEVLVLKEYIFLNFEQCRLWYSHSMYGFEVYCCDLEIWKYILIIYKQWGKLLCTFQRHYDDKCFPFILYHYSSSSILCSFHSFFYVVNK